MHRNPRIASLTIAAFVVASALSAAPALARQPASTIAGDSHGFVLASEKPTNIGSFVDVFKSSTGSVTIDAAPGTTVSFAPTAPDSTGHGSMMVTVTPPIPTSSLKEASAVGPTQAQQLSDLGVSAPQKTQASGVQPMVSGGSPTPGDSYPYKSNCISINALSGAVQGSGCSNVYAKYKNGQDWYVANEYWAMAAEATSQGYLGLWLQGLGYESTWVHGNTIYSVTPTTSIGTNCSNVNLAISGGPISGSISGSICNDLLAGWNVAVGNYSPVSGSRWQGDTQGLWNYEYTEGVQLVHNPPAVATSWSDSWIIWYCNGVC